MQRVDIAALAAASPMRGREPDRFQYELMIEDEDGRREVAVSEDRVPDELQPLLDRVRSQGSG